MILKQTFKNHIIVSRFAWLTAIAFLITWGFTNYDQSFILGIGSFYLLTTIPAVYLHISYAINNAGEIIEIKNNEIIISKSGVVRKFSINDIKRIVLFQSASLNKGGMPFTAMEYYRFVRIKFISNEEIIITCLMDLKLEELVKQFSRTTCERKNGLAFLFRS